MNRREFLSMLPVLGLPVQLSVSRPKKHPKYFYSYLQRYKPFAFAAVDSVQLPPDEATKLLKLLERKLGQRIALTFQFFVDNDLVDEVTTSGVLGSVSTSTPSRPFVLFEFHMDSVEHSTWSKRPLLSSINSILFTIGVVER